ncbi:MAG TPA: SMP-30/gluconolactonase/LRE family protein, partial [Dehalococcoidia bacterium]|nr:SMP-30/gluconolactonase/LRE family protein [Dehalococcoidia bacterium]
HLILPFLIIIVAVLAFPMDSVTRFLMYWLVLTFLALTIAGEKMPWLNVHLALPLAVLAGRFVGHIVQSSDLRDDLPRIERLAPYAYAAVASALAITVFVLTGPYSLPSVGAWILVIVAAASVYWAYTGYSPRTAVQVATVGAVAAFAVFSLRAGVLASWGHPDNPYVGNAGDVATRDYGEVPIEMLVYTQTSGDIPILRDLIDQAAADSGLGSKLPIIVDSSDGFTWPWAWYLRDYDGVGYQDLSCDAPPDTSQQPIILAARDAGTCLQLGEGYAEGVPYHHRRWFPEEYRKGADFSMRDFWSDVVQWSTWEGWLDYWVRRTLPAPEPGTVDGIAFFPTVYEGVPAQPAGPTVRTEGTHIIIGGRGSARGQLNAPSDVAFDSQGNIYVADTDNNRIQKYSPEGELQAVAGGFGQVDVTLRQPWSMVVTSDGTVFVADTWNHRIVKLNSDLQVEDEWGAGAQTAPGDDPFGLFGPREIALTAGGTLLVADTGNSRIIEYSQDGEALRQFGGPNSSDQPVKLSEPVGIVTGPQGEIYIADFWNKRILVLDDDLSTIREIAVPSWGSQAVTDRPYMALLTDGRLLATDPANGKVLVFDAQGQQVAAYDVPVEQGQAAVRPIGLASDGTNVLVSDSIGHVVRKIPLSEVAP